MLLWLRPRRRAQDAIAEIHQFHNHGYRWVLEADIEACFDSIDHTALTDRVRRRVGDKRVLALAKAFLKAGILTADGAELGTVTGMPKGGILSPLLAKIALGQRKLFSPRDNTRGAILGSTVKILHVVTLGRRDIPCDD